MPISARVSSGITLGYRQIPRCKWQRMQCRIRAIGAALAVSDSLQPLQLFANATRNFYRHGKSSNAGKPLTLAILDRQNFQSRAALRQAR
jgi:hypothetical protein